MGLLVQDRSGRVRLRERQFLTRHFEVRTGKEGCTTPFVYLYQVSEKNDRKFTFPSTRKALASFAEVEQLTLVEFHEAGGWRLGLKTASKEQAEAVVAHLRSTMKDEKPELRCYEPRNPRVIPVKKP